MKNCLSFALSAAAIVSASLFVSAAEPAGAAAVPAASATPPAVADLKTELAALVSKVNEKIKAGKTTAEALADELKEFDALLARHKDQKSEEAAEAAAMRAMLYADVLEDFDRGEVLLRAIIKDYPGTRIAEQVEKSLPQLAAQREAAKARSALKSGATFPAFEEKDLEGKTLTLAQYRGKVVLVDFWATWCGPCVNELPNVIAAYEKYRAKGFEIVGISLDQDKEKLTSFLKKHKMEWPQVFDGKGWDSKLAAQYGIQSIPATFLLDGDGKIVASGLRGKQLDEELEKLLAKK